MAESKGFNLADVIKAVPKLDTADGRKQIEYIDIDLLDDDPRNFYALSDLDTLADNIATVGLQQPLVVRPDPDKTGRYIIVSGHRRRAAVRKLVEDGREDLRRLPCLLDSSDESPALQELRLIFANSGTRKLTDPEIAAQAERVQMLLYRLKDEGFDFPGRMRDHVAEACQISKSKLARLKVIEKGLDGYAKQLWKEGKLNESAAYALARMPFTYRTSIAAVSGGKGLDGTKLDVLQKRIEKSDTRLWTGDKLTCPDGGACKHRTGFVRHALDHPWDEDCDGSMCCLNCPRGTKCDCYACSQMCSKAKAARKELKAEKQAKEERALKANNTKAQRSTIPNARRILKAAEAAGLPDYKYIPWEWANQINVKTLRQWANGDFSEGWSKWWSTPQLIPKFLRMPYDAATLLQCSADYLLGLTDDLQPSALAPTKYITGQIPDCPTEAAALFDLGDGLNLYRTFVRWDGKRWTFSGGVTIDSPCVGWFPIPDTPKTLEPAGDQTENMSVEEADDDDET